MQLIFNGYVTIKNLKLLGGPVTIKMLIAAHPTNFLNDNHSEIILDVCIKFLTC